MKYVKENYCSNYEDLSYSENVKLSCNNIFIYFSVIRVITK